MNAKIDFLFRSASIYCEKSVTLNADCSASCLIFQKQAALTVVLWRSGHPATKTSEEVSSNLFNRLLFHGMNGE